MTKIHIALVGNQTEPVYQGIEYSQPDEVFFVVSKRTHAKAQTVESFFRKIKFHYEQFPPASIAEVYQRIENLKKKLPEGSSVSINLVGGTKSWSIAFFDVFRGTDAELLLVDQHNKVFSFTTKEETEIPIDWKKRFLLHDCEPVNYTEFKDYTEEDFKAARTLEKIWSEDNQSFTNLTTDMAPRRPSPVPGQKRKVKLSEYVRLADRGFNENNGDRVSYQKPDRVSIEMKDRGEIELKSPHAIDLAFNTGWFEVKVAQLLADWGQNRFMICGAEMCGSKTKEVNALNEYDLIIFTGSRLVFVECKTAIANYSDIDKFANGVKIYGGTSSCGVFITYFRINKTGLEKMRRNKIRHFCLKDGLSNAMLFKELDDLVSEINES